MKWIKFKKEKPNFDFESIVCDKHGNVTSAWYRKQKIWEDYEGDELYDVTDWMPMPKAP